METLSPVMPGSAAKVQEAIDDKRPDFAHEAVEARFTARREGSLRKSAKGPL
jgi:hypothetical protein